eukprot:1976650-Pleurochrysis_carterae.AAC.1
MVNDVSAEQAILHVVEAGGQLNVVTEKELPCFVRVDGLRGLGRNTRERVGDGEREVDFIRISKVELDGETAGSRGRTKRGAPTIGGQEWAFEFSEAYR